MKNGFKKLGVEKRHCLDLIMLKQNGQKLNDETSILDICMPLLTELNIPKEIS